MSNIKSIIVPHDISINFINNLKKSMETTVLNFQI